ncbi:hypothetical protein AcW1_001437 [Taiwanofungus camphoratus]|nr:hypothetical protein AcW1_001437 [Antrodia cinnamomea]
MRERERERVRGTCVHNRRRGCRFISAHHDHASSKALRRLLFSLFLSYPILSYPVLSGRASTVVVPHSIVPGLWSEVAWAAARLRSLVRARSTLLAGGDREGCLEGRSAAQ